jgi:hypothetical protein
LFIPLKRQILRNCDISDARHAGLFSVCGLALRLRDLYKWHHRLAPWQEDEAERVLAWIGEKEDLWESLLDMDYGELVIENQHLDPFDTTAINAALLPLGLFYGAGYAHSLKPTFFLARIKRRESMSNVPGNISGNLSVWHLGREYARDLLTLPAFTQDQAVVLRTETARMFMWDQMVYINNSSRSALAFALEACCGGSDGSPDFLRRHLDRIMQIQHIIFIRHEIGELDESVFDRQTWRRLVADHPHSAVELLVRTLKDMLADTGPSGTLSYLIQCKETAGLGFYIAFLQGLTSCLFSELPMAFSGFMSDLDWTHMAAAATAARRKAEEYSLEIMDIYAQGRLHDNTAQVKTAIEATMRRRGLLGKP